MGYHFRASMRPGANRRDHMASIVADASMRPGANRRDHGPDTGCHTISSCAALCERSPNVLTASPAEPLNPTLIRYRHWSARSAGGHSGRVGLAVELTRRTRAGGGQGRRVEVVTDGCPLRGGRSSRAGRRVLTARGGAIVGSKHRAHGWHRKLYFFWTIPLELITTYSRTRFSEAAIRNTLAEFDEIFNTQRNLYVQNTLLSVTKGNQTWEFDDEDEFFTYYSDCDHAIYRRWIAAEDSAKHSASFGIRCTKATTTVSIETYQDYLKAGKRGSILSVFRILAEHEDDCRLPRESIEPVIFIGHGRNQAWRDLKDHLTDKHDYRVEAYEAGARAGHTIRDILESMLTASGLGRTAASSPFPKPSCRQHRARTDAGKPGS